MFGSILTLGGLIGAVFSGKVADVLGRKRVRRLIQVSVYDFCEPNPNAVSWFGLTRTGFYFNHFSHFF